MAYETKPGQGVIFKNENKQSSNHPDYNGKIKTPEGREYDLSMWVKDGKKGKFFSVSVKEPYVKQSQHDSFINRGNGDLGDDLPF